MSRARHIGILLVLVFLAFLSAAETLAGVRGGTRRVGNRRAIPDHVVAYAALDPLESDTGWGRFVVRDDLLPSGDERTVRVAVFGLEADAEYMVEADGVEVGAIVTDRKGNGEMQLKTRGRRSDDVPLDLPPASEIIGASVYDTWRTTVLEGEFAVVREHITDPKVYSETIRLEDETGGDAKGMAAVCRKESGAQAFATKAAGLEPKLTYSIVVDTSVAGIVTADEEGQAGLELHVPADENPLPDALQPVDNIRNVQWFQGDLLILAGVFTGESDNDDRCDEIEGTFVELTEDGFVLRIGGPDTGADTEIVVTDGTEFEGFDNLGELEEGDRLEVEACWDGERFVAESVELEERELECHQEIGTFVELTEDGFLLRTKKETFAVIITDDTRFSGFDSLDALEEGDALLVKGCGEDQWIIAKLVKLFRNDDCVEVRGVVAEGRERGFVLQVGEEFVEVAVTDETHFRGFESLEELDGGEAVAIEGCFDGEALVAKWIKLLEDDEPKWWEVDGTIVDLMENGFALSADGAVTKVIVTDETILEGYENSGEIAEGDVVFVEGPCDGEKLFAKRVVLIEHGT